ncbi:MAG: penicillin-binding protein 1A [Pseudomonadota bacterium]
MAMKLRTRLLRLFLFATLLGGLAASLSIAGVYFYLTPKLPDTHILKAVQLQEPLRIYSRDGKLIAEYGEMKRNPLNYSQFPEKLVQAFIAAEDNRFFEHPGVDYQGILRAALNLIITGERGQGGSTITMQVARNFFLSREKTYIRKLNEILLALKIERELSKEEILELYLNKIYLGKRAYGVGAASQVYYGKPLEELELAQLAMIAGLPKAPSAYNPINNPDRATLRRNYVLGRMNELAFISPGQYREALSAPVSAREHRSSAELDAPHVAEMARKAVLERYGDDAYNLGYSVYTTVDSRLQRAANQALHDGLLAYEHRHGYRGPEGHIDLDEETDSESWQRTLAPLGTIGGLQPALVTELEEQSAHIALEDGSRHTIEWEGLAWARPYLSDTAMGPEPEQAGDILKPGDIIRVEQNGEGLWQLAQVPEVAGALVSLDPNSGAILALTGGFDYYQSKFNRVTQAERQPGSNFKPFIYSAALESGFTPASLINDAPVVFEDSALESAWRPENYSGRFYGPTRLREALVKSRNLVSIRLLQSTGISAAIRHAANFGFLPERLPRDLSLSLGSATLTPLEIVRGYATFANSGFLIDPHIITRIDDNQGEALFEATPAIACDDACRKRLEEERLEQGERVVDSLPTTADAEADTETPSSPELAPRTVDARNVYLIRTMLQDVIRRGTGRQALKLGRNDLAGKTGTTNDQKDAWFSGFNNDVVTTTWVGFDTPRSLGNYETGARAALPIWIDYMREALRDRPEHTMEQPEGLVSVRIDAETGRYSAGDNPNAIFELFREENAPKPEPGSGAGRRGDNSETNTIRDELF